MKRMTATRDHEDYRRILHLSAKPEWAQVWHAWTVIIPRRALTGELVWGSVLRRHDGRRWIYKGLR